MLDAVHEKQEALGGPLPTGAGSSFPPEKYYCLSGEKLHTELSL